MSPRSISKAEYRALAELRYSLRQFLRFSEAAARAARLTPQHHQALLALKGFSRNNSLTIGELARRLQILPHSAVGLADRLARAGLAARRHGTADRRVVFLSLTARGQAVLERLTAVHRQELRRLGPRLKTLLDALRNE